MGRKESNQIKTYVTTVAQLKTALVCNCLGLLKGQYQLWKRNKKLLPRVRLELTASAYHSTVYKYGALTDCATGAILTVGGEKLPIYM